MKSTVVRPHQACQIGLKAYQSSTKQSTITSFLRRPTGRREASSQIGTDRLILQNLVAPTMGHDFYENQKNVPTKVSLLADENLARCDFLSL